MRDYGVEGQIGLEETPYEYISSMRILFAMVRRVLKSDGTVWLNMGDSYAASGKGWGGGEISAMQYESCGKQDGSRRKPPFGYKKKDLCGMPWQLAFALRDDGWYLRQDIVWAKPNPMPESVADRCTKSHEYIFLLSKSEKYYFDQKAILEKASYADEAVYDNGQNGHGGGESHEGQGSSTRKFRKSVPAGWETKSGEDAPKHTPAERPRDRDKDPQYGMVDMIQRNKRSAWTVPTQPFPEAHFATFPEDLIRPCILAGCPAGGVVLDPFLGSGTTALVARKNHCRAIGIELNADYIEIAKRRLSQEVLSFT